MQWFWMSPACGINRGKWPETFGIEDGDVYLPAIIAGDEMHILICTAYDGIHWATRNSRIYVAADWMAECFPKKRLLCTALAARARLSARHSHTVLSGG